MYANIGSGNGLLPDGTRPLPDGDFTASAVLNNDSEIILLKLLPYSPGANEFGT